MDRLTQAQRSRLMAAVKGRNTGPERIVRKLVHALGYRFRLQKRGLPGTPDLVLSRLRAVILVHGCFWHAHSCRWGREPRSNKAYWREKRRQNRTRDRRTVAALRRRGWRVLVVWGCQTKTFGRLRTRVLAFLTSCERPALYSEHPRAPGETLPVTSWRSPKSREKR